MPSPDNNELTPAQVMEQVARAIPEACRSNVIIIGSLAAGYHFFGNDQSKAIRTKDVDAMFSPHAMAVHHVTPLAAIGGKYRVDPVRDLIPLCASCHQIAHRRSPPYSVAEIKYAIEQHAIRS